MAPETAPTPGPVVFDSAGMIDYLMSVPDTSTNAATLIVGDTGAGKTHLLCTAAEYNWEVHQKKTRLYMGDLGGLGTKGQSLVRLGILEFWRLRNHIEAFETCELASLGYWPATGTLDRYTGYADPNAQLVPPQFSEWAMTCPQGHLVKAVRHRNQLTQTQCPSCQTLTGPANWQVTERVFRSPGFAQIGGWLFEGLTSWQDWIMDDMAARTGRGELEGEKSALGGKIISGDLSFGANNRAHYGFAQIRAQQWINNSLKIPGATMPPVWTALLQRGTDSDRGIPIYGPKIAGNAKTSDVPAWVGNCLEAAVDKDEKRDDRWTLHLRTFSRPEEGNIPHLCKHRSEPDALPAFLRDQPNQPLFTEFSLKYFFTLLNGALANSIKRDAQKYPNAPALVGVLDQVEVPEMLSERAMSVVSAPAGAARPAAGPPKPVVPAGVRAPGTPGAVAPAPSKPAAAMPPAPGPVPPAPVAPTPPVASQVPPVASPRPVVTPKRTPQQPPVVAAQPAAPAVQAPAVAQTPRVVQPPQPPANVAPAVAQTPARVVPRVVPPGQVVTPPAAAVAAPAVVAPAAVAPPALARPAAVPIRPPARPAVMPAGRRPIPTTPAAAAPATAGGPSAPGTE